MRSSQSQPSGTSGPNSPSNDHPPAPSAAEMVSRVALVLWDTDERNAQAWSWAECPSYLKVEFLRRARAAIEAMREPTRDMLRAAQAAPATHSDGWGFWAGDSDIYRAMIDAARGQHSPIHDSPSPPVADHSTGSTGTDQ